MLNLILAVIKKYIELRTFPNPFKVGNDLSYEEIEKYNGQWLTYSLLSLNLRTFSLFKKNVYKIPDFNINQALKDSSVFSFIFFIMSMCTCFLFALIFPFIYLIPVIVIINILTGFVVMMTWFHFFTKPVDEFISNHSARKEYVRLRLKQHAFDNTLKFSFWRKFMKTKNPFSLSEIDNFKSTRQPYTFVMRNNSSFNINILRNNPEVMKVLKLSSQKQKKQSKEKIMVIFFMILLFLGNILFNLSLSRAGIVINILLCVSPVILALLIPEIKSITRDCKDIALCNYLDANEAARHEFFIPFESACLKKNTVVPENASLPIKRRERL